MENIGIFGIFEPVAMGGPVTKIGPVGKWQLVMCPLASGKLFPLAGRQGGGSLGSMVLHSSTGNPRKTYFYLFWGIFYGIFN